MSETMKMPALAVVGPDRRIVRSTESFRQRYEDAEKMCEKSPELDRVLTGRADVATLSLGDVSVEIVAVTDAAGCRQAMLSLPTMESTPVIEAPVSVLHDAAASSPAMVWVKDLDGRYLFANERFISDLRTSETRLLGKTDREVPELETVDGPRVRYAEDGLKEPLELEYTIPAVDRRPALAVIRFPIRDEHDHPVATCGIAAPVAEARLAREEAMRLMQLERWNRLDPVAVRAELLQQWHVQTAKARASEPEDEGPASPSWDVIAAAHEEEAAPMKRTEPISRPTEATAAPMPAPPPTQSLDSATPTLSETAELLQSNLELVRQWADQAQELQDELQQARAAAARADEHGERLRTELEQTRLDLDQARAEAQAAKTEAEALRVPSSVALRLSEELGQAVAAERERSEELERMLSRLGSQLTEFESAHD